MDAHVHSQVHPALLRQTAIALTHRFRHPESGPHRPLGIILMGIGVAEIDEQAIAEILSNMALIALDDLGTRILVGPHHLASAFRVKLVGEPGRVHEVAKQHSELAEFGLKRTRLSALLGLLGL